MAHWRDLAGLALIVLLAAALRLGRSGVVEYFHDDAMLSTLALELAHGLSFPLTGILSSTGIPNSPVSAYLLAFPFSLSPDPATVIQVIMIWNVLGVALFWGLARRYFGGRIAFIAGLFYATNPWAVLFSRKIWAQELHTPIIMLGLMLLLFGYWHSHDGRRRTRAIFAAQCLSLPLLLFGVQFHFAAWPLIIVVPYVVWLGRERIVRRAFVGGIVLSLLAILPFAIGLARTLETDPNRISDALSRSAERGPGFSLESTGAIAQLATAGGLEHWLAPDQAAELAAAYSPLLPLTLFLLPIMFAGIGAVYARKRQFAFLLLIWAFLPCALLTVEWTPVYIHYFIPSIPALALLIGFGWDWLLRLLARSRPLRLAVWAGLLLLLALQLQAWNAALSFVEENHVDYPGFTTPLANLLPLRDALVSADDVLIVAGGMSWNLHHEVAVWETLLWGEASCIRTIVPAGYAVLPDHPFSAVITPDAAPGPGADFYRNDNPERFPTRAGGGDYALYQWGAAPSWPGPAIQPIDPKRFANNVRLSGYGLAEGRVILEWRLPARQVGADYQFSAQLFDSQDRRIGQLDATFWHGRHWCAGDRLLTWGPIADAEEASALKVALYRLGTGKQVGQIVNLEVLDGMGNPQGQSVDIALVSPAG